MAGNVSLRQTLLLSGIAFGVTLGLVIGLRLDPAALAAVVGVGCGIGASVPGVLFVLWMMRSRQHDAGRQRLARRQEQWGQPSPPVVVISPSAQSATRQDALQIASGRTRQLPADDNGERLGLALPVQREFVVIGDEDDGW